MSKKKNRVICIDFDGVIAKYDTWQGKGIFGEPLPDARKFIRKLKKEGWKIIVHTTRLEIYLIQKYLVDYGIPFDHINYNPENIKRYCHPNKPLADVYLDDRAVNFDGDWENAYQRIICFRPWYKNNQSHSFTMPVKGKI